VSIRKTLIFEVEKPYYWDSAEGKERGAERERKWAGKVLDEAEDPLCF
jgi:hypothetical protein